MFECFNDYTYPFTKIPFNKLTTMSKLTTIKSYKEALTYSIECKKKFSTVLTEINYAITRSNVSDTSPQFIFMSSISSTRMQSIICIYCSNYIEIKNKKLNKLERNADLYCNHHKTHHPPIYRFLEIKKINENLLYYQLTKQSYLLHRALLRMVIYKHPKLKQIFRLLSEWLDTGLENHDWMY